MLLNYTYQNIQYSISASWNGPDGSSSIHTAVVEQLSALHGGAFMAYWDSAQRLDEKVDKLYSCINLFNNEHYAVPYNPKNRDHFLMAFSDYCTCLEAGIASDHSPQAQVLLHIFQTVQNILQETVGIYLVDHAYQNKHFKRSRRKDKRPQLIVWEKDAVSGQLLQGATFKATCISNGMAKTAESGPDGKAVFDDLMPNEEYRIEEIDPPPYFLPSTKVETVVIPDGSYQTIELTWENQPYSGLTIRKVSATDGRGLKGAVFGLYQGTEAESKAFLGEFQTDDNGRIVIDKLESNQYYTVVERQPPVNHLPFREKDKGTGRGCR